MRIRFGFWLVAWSFVLSTCGPIANAQDVINSPQFFDPDSQPREVAEANAVNLDPSSFQQQLDAMRAELFQLKNAPSKPKYPTVEIHGVFQTDTGWFNQSQSNINALKDIQTAEGVPIGPPNKTNGNLQDGSDFRRARLSANGAVKYRPMKVSPPK